MRSDLMEIGLPVTGQARSGPPRDELVETAALLAGTWLASSFETDLTKISSTLAIPLLLGLTGVEQARALSVLVIIPATSPTKSGSPPASLLATHFLSQVVFVAARSLLSSLLAAQFLL